MEAVELARSVGLPLDPWQDHGLDVMLAVDDGYKWVCFEYAEICSRQNGKSYLGEARVLAGLFLLSERLILWSAHRYSTAMESFRHVREIIEGSDALSRRLKRISNTNGEEAIELHGEGANRVTGAQRLRFLARTKQSGRGFTGDCNIIDEALFYTEDQQSALMPTMSARPNPQIVYLSSPPMESDEGEVLFRLKARGESGADPSLAYRDWGVAGDLANLDQLDLDDRRLWAAANPALGIRINEEHIARERASMSPRDFARERLGVWPPEPAAAKGVHDLRVWSALTDPGSRVVGDLALAIDVTPARDHSSISVYGLRLDGTGHTELVAYRPGVAWLVPALVQLKDKHNPVAIGLDAKGPAGALLVQLEKAGIRPPSDPDKPARGDLAILGAQDVASAWGQWLDAVAASDLHHLGQLEMTGAIGNAKTRDLGDAKALARRTATGDISPLTSATFARWAYMTRIDKITDDADPGAWWV